MDGCAIVCLNGELHIFQLATVRGNELDCYNWEDGEDLVILDRLDVLDDKHSIFLYKVYNVDRNEFGGVSSDQIIMATTLH